LPKYRTVRAEANHHGGVGRELAQRDGFNIDDRCTQILGS
jgi:hypothetical protein